MSLQKLAACACRVAVGRMAWGVTSACTRPPSPSAKSVPALCRPPLCLPRQPCRGHTVEETESWTLSHVPGATRAPRLLPFLPGSPRLTGRTDSRPRHAERPGWLEFQHLSDVAELGEPLEPRVAGEALAFTGRPSPGFLETARVLRLPGFSLPQIRLVDVVLQLNSALRPGSLSSPPSARGHSAVIFSRDLGDSGREGETSFLSTPSPAWTHTRPLALHDKAETPRQLTEPFFTGGITTFFLLNPTRKLCRPCPSFGGPRG